MSEQLYITAGWIVVSFVFGMFIGLTVGYLLGVRRMPELQTIREHLKDEYKKI